MTMKYMCKCGELVEINAVLDYTLRSNVAMSFPMMCKNCGGVQIIEFSLGNHYPEGTLFEEA